MKIFVTLSYVIEKVFVLTENQMYNKINQNMQK